MKTTVLRLPHGHYPIIVGTGVIRRISRTVEGERALLVCDRALPKAFVTQLRKILVKNGWKVSIFSVQADEKLKDFSRIYDLAGKFLKFGADRDSVVFALGGGTVGDAAGFLASIFNRGIRWVGLPTTLLAQVDSAIGGKTAVNHPLGKNLLGTFFQPSLVVCELSYLKTLPTRELVSGLGEVIKYGLIYDRAFYRYCMDHLHDLLSRDERSLEKVVEKCAHFKAQVVAKDEFDRKGMREALNFGHTIGHALEACAGYGYFRHGEAVLWGMRAEATLSHVMGTLSHAELQTILTDLRKIPLKRLPRNLRFNQLLSKIKRDKKNKAGRIRCVLLKSIGCAVKGRAVTPMQIRRALKIAGVIS